MTKVTMVIGNNPNTAIKDHSTITMHKGDNDGSIAAYHYNTLALSLLYIHTTNFQLRAGSYCILRQFMIQYMNMTLIMQQQKKANKIVNAFA